MKITFENHCQILFQKFGIPLFHRAAQIYRSQPEREPLGGQTPRKTLANPPPAAAAASPVHSPLAGEPFRVPMAMAQRAFGSLLRRSLGLAPPTSQRALSASAAPAASAPTAAAAAEGEAAKAKRAKKKNLFDVVQFLPDWGVGYKVAKTTWRDVSYQITKINLYKVNHHPSISRPRPRQISSLLCSFQ